MQLNKAGYFSLGQGVAILLSAELIDERKCAIVRSKRWKLNIKFKKAGIRTSLTCQRSVTLFYNKKQNVYLVSGRR